MAQRTSGDGELESRQIALEVLVTGGRNGAASKHLKKKKKGNGQQGRARAYQSVEQALGSHEGFKSLAPRDRSFVKLLCITVERREGQIDAVLRKLMREYPPKLGRAERPVVQACLRLGVCQLLFLSTPPHAAVHSSVELMRRASLPPPLLKLVNAVLRSCVEDGGDWLRNSSSPTDNIAPWLVAEWEDQWGAAATAQVCEVALQEPSLDLTLKNTSQTHAQEWAEKLNGTVLPTGTVRRSTFQGTGDVTKLPGFEEGAWWVQDAAAALPALALLSVVTPSLSSSDSDTITRVGDVCAAPGGKTAQLIAAGCSVTAVETNDRRAVKLSKNLHRLGLESRCSVVVSDAKEWLPEQPLDAVLLDAPCSATGTARRRPDVLRKGASLLDCVGSLPDIQFDLAMHCASDAVLKADGGVLVYATCSLLMQEGEHVARRLLEACEDRHLETLPLRPSEVPGFEAAVTEEGWLRVLPGMMPSLRYDASGDSPSSPSVSTGLMCDGFFIARFVKK